MSCPTVTYQLPGICRNSHDAAKYVAADLRVCDFCINTHTHTQWRHPSLAR